MMTKIARKYFRIVTLISLVISILVHITDIIDLITGHRERYQERSHEDMSDLIFYVIATAFITLTMFILNFYLLKPLDHNKRLVFKNIAISIISTFIVAFIAGHFFVFLKYLVHHNPEHDFYHLEHPVRIFIMMAIVLGSFFIIRLIFHKQAIEIENERLKTESLQSQFESLKNQVSPHFLFNSLNALKTLIRESPDIAQEYVNHLSLVLRYTLQGNDKQTVSLSDEMEFVSSYLFLLKMRYDSNLNVITKISENYNSYSLPPLTIQTLIENAVKHNEISKRKPLTIQISTSKNKTLIITNNMQEKLTPEEGTGIGLSNLSKRYHLLSGQDIIVKKEKNEFIVEVPLL